MVQTRLTIGKVSNGYILTKGKQSFVIEGDQDDLARNFSIDILKEVDKILKSFTLCQLEMSVSGVSYDEWYTREQIPCDRLPLICMNKGYKNPEILYYYDGRFFYSPDCVGQYRSKNPEFWRYAPKL